MSWSVVPTSAVLDPNNAANVSITFTATQTGGAVLTKTASSSNWTIEKEVAFRQDWLADLLRTDQLKAASAAFLPNVQAYISGNPAPVTG